MMNLLQLFCLISFCSVIFGERLYHREGRFIDVSINRYKTNLPSIHDIANTFIHYRMPVAIFIPTVRLNYRSKQKRIQFSNFPTIQLAETKNQQSNQSIQELDQNKYQTNNEQDNQFKNIKQEIIPTNDIISRNGWTARSLNKPTYKPTRNEIMLKKFNLNYANLPESNVDLIPFLYSDKISKQVSTTTNLFNSQYQLSNSNPNRILSQNIAYIQPNSLAPFQPNIVLFPSTSSNQPNLILNNELKRENQSSVNSLPIVDETLKINNQSKPITELSSTTVNNNVSTAEISQFDVSQIGTNPTDIELENVQNHESLDNIPVVPVQNEIINNSTENISNNNLQSSNSTTMISNLTSNSNTEQLERSNSDNQPSIQPIEFDKLYISDNPFINQFKSRLIKQYNTVPNTNSNPLKPKNIITPRSHRSLSIDLPSMASYLTAAVAQSGHSNEQRKNLYRSFLNNYN